MPEAAPLLKLARADAADFRPERNTALAGRAPACKLATWRVCGAAPVSTSVNDFSRYPKLPAELLCNARVLPDRLAALPLWPKDAVIAEIGVALGGLSAEILSVCRPRKFLAIDRFDLHELPMLWGEPTKTLFGGRTHLDFYRDRFASEIADGVVEVIEGDSAPSIAALPDDSVDLFYVDADHLYGGVKNDLRALLPKVRADGWVVMNDYIPADTFSNEPLGVIQATNEFMVENEWEMVYFALAPVMYCDVALRRVGGGAVIPDKALAAALSATERRLRAAEERAQALEAALAATRRSTSWRITAPLRSLSRRVLFRRADAG
jgi:hypothetical protein